MKIWPNTRLEFLRIALHAAIGTNVAVTLHNVTLTPPDIPRSHVTIHTPSESNLAYVLPATRYEDLTAIEDTDQGTVKFVRWVGDKPRYDFNFKYDFVVTAQGDHMFDKGSKYMPPDLGRDFDTVKKGFCQRHQTLVSQRDHPMAKYCANVAELAAK